MVDVTQLFTEPTFEELITRVQGAGRHHDYYYETKKRGDIMSLFYNATDVENVDTDTLKFILKKSVVESDADYESRLERTPMIPFEKMFVRAKERIFQGHGVQRTFPEDGADADFWEYVQKKFDDKGDSIDKFFRKKAFHYKEVLGFSGIVVDLLTAKTVNDDGQLEIETYTDDTGQPVPYSYLARPEQIYDYEMHQGFLRYMVIRTLPDKDNPADYEYRIYTPKNVYVVQQFVEMDKQGVITETVEELTMQSSHPFGQVPFVFLKGEEDLDSGFEIGRPERYSLVDLYRVAIEIAYDLQEVSLLYGHPIPVMGEGQVKELIGALDSDGKYNPEVISAKLGAVVQIPDNQDFPNKMFFQPDTGGMDHLKNYLFEIIEVVHKFASIRDKTQVVSNVSGVAKALDTVEERGVLAASSRDMERTERAVLELYAAARPDTEFNKDWVQYQKEFDLSTASEHMKILIEGSAQNALTFELYKYHATEALRKAGASETKVKEVGDKLEEVGKPIRTSVQELVALVGREDEPLTEALAKQVKILEHYLERRKELGIEFDPDKADENDPDSDFVPEFDEEETE